MDTGRIRRRRVRRFIAYSLTILIALITVLGCWGYYQWQNIPGYWTANQKFLESTQSNQIDQMAMSTENQILNLFSMLPENNDAFKQNQTQSKHKNKPKPQQKKIKLSTREVNAWLDRRLMAWASNRDFQLPPEIKNMMVHPENGAIAVAFEYEKNQMQKVVTLLFEVQMIGHGKAMIHLTQLRGNSLPAKPSWLVNNVNDQQLKQVVTELIQGKTIDLKFPYEMGGQQRIMTIKDFVIHKNGIIADIETE